MILVVNKMARTGNTPENQCRIEQDIRNVLPPDETDNLRICFLDAESYLDYMVETDEEIKEELLERSGYEVFVDCLNDFAILKHGFIDGYIKSSIKEELIDKDFHIKSKSDDLYSMVRLEDINKYNKLSGLKRKKIVAQDGPSDYIRKVINSLSEEEFNLFIEYHLKTCERKELLGASSHILDIVEKKKVKDA